MESLNDDNDDLNEQDNDDNSQSLSLKDEDGKDVAFDELEDLDENISSFSKLNQKKKSLMREYMEDDDDKQLVIVPMEEYELSMT